MPLVHIPCEKLYKKNIYQYFLELINEWKKRFDEVDEAVPNKRMTIHEILLKGKRAPRLPFEDDLRPPGGKID